MLKLKVNDIDVEVEEGTTVLQACEQAGRGNHQYAPAAEHQRPANLLDLPGDEHERLRRRRQGAGGRGLAGGFGRRGAGFEAGPRVTYVC